MITIHLARLMPLALVASISVFGQSGPIPSTFFGMSIEDANDYPTISFGAMGHPPAVGWARVERQRGEYDWGPIAQYVKAANANGLDAMITFEGTPAWAVSDRSKCQTKFSVTFCPNPPDNLQDWKDFITAVATHFNGHDGAPPIQYYEIWNEANTRNSFTGTYSDLVSMAEAAYSIIHAISPQSLVLTPSVVGATGGPLPGNAAAWMAAYLQAGGSKYADVGAFHGYVFKSNAAIGMPESTIPAGCVPNTKTVCHGSILTLVSAMRQVFDANGLAGKPMFDTEGSWGDCTLADSNSQVEWLARWYILQAAAGVNRVYWYSWARPSEGWGPLLGSSGKPTPAALAYGYVENWLTGATISPCTQAGTIWSCEITRAGGYSGLILWNTAGIGVYAPASAFKQYTDLSSNIGTIPANGSVIIGPKPILLESGTPGSN